MLEDYSASKSILDKPPAIYEFWKTLIAVKPDFEPEKENVFAIMVNTRFQPIAYNLVALGSLNECIAHPREIFRPAIVSGAFGFAMTHNHPSGDPSPSEADRRLTSRIKEGAEILRLNFLDHVVIGQPGPDRFPYFSFREAGLL